MKLREITKRRLLMGAAAIIALAAAFALIFHPADTTNVSSMKIPVTSVAAPATPAWLSTADNSYAKKLRNEQPKIFMACPGHGQEAKATEIRPNLVVLATVKYRPLSADYPNGLEITKFDDTVNITVDFQSDKGVGIFTWTPSKEVEAYGAVYHHNLGNDNHDWKLFKDKLFPYVVGDLEHNVTWHLLGREVNDKACTGRRWEEYLQVNWAYLFTHRLYTKP